MDKNKSSLVKTRPRGLLRLFLRLPVLLYRLKLGWLLGERFLLLKHVGRKSGKIRQVVVEVVAHDKVEDTYYIASGWGYHSNWYQNLLKTPNVEIQVGLRKLAVVAQTLPPPRGVELLLAYRRKHPFAARELSRLMGLDIVNAPLPELEKVVKESLPVIALQAINSI